eukprot:4762150-Alexandrium_andersonii.AAC.1
MSASLVGSEMCIRDSPLRLAEAGLGSRRLDRSRSGRCRLVRRRACHGRGAGQQPAQEGRRG